MPKAEKVEKVKNIKEKIAASSSLILTDYRGMTANQITDLRKKLHPLSAEYEVVKNRLGKLALQKDEEIKLKDLLKGPTAVAYGRGDPALPAKVIYEFIEEHSKPLVKGGIIEGKFQDAAAIKMLSKLPSREVLIAKVVSGMASPIYSLVYVLSGTIRKLVYVLDAIKISKA